MANVLLILFEYLRETLVNFPTALLLFSSVRYQVWRILRSYLHFHIILCPFGPSKTKVSSQEGINDFSIYPSKNCEIQRQNKTSQTTPGQHDDSLTSCLPNHLPKVINCAFQWSLSAQKTLWIIKSGYVIGVDVVQALNVSSITR